MPSYLSSTQTGTPSRFTISAASSAGEASMNLIGWKSARLASSSRSSRASSAIRPMSPVSIPAHLTSSSGRSNAFAIAASTSPSRRPIRSSPREDLDDVLRGQRVRSGQQVAEDPALGRRPRRRPRWRRTRRRPRAASARRPGPGRGRRVSGRRPRRAPGPTTGRRPRRGPCGGLAARSVTVVAIADQPRPAARWSASANGRPVRKTAAMGSSSAVRPRGSRRGAPSSRRSGSWRRRARRPRSSDAWRRWYTVPPMAPRTLVSRGIGRRARRPPTPRARTTSVPSSAGTPTPRSSA